MTKPLTFLAFAACALLTAGCADAPEPAPRLEAAELDRLLAKLDQQAAAAQAPAAVPDQIAAADRVANTVGRLEPARLDPNLLASAIAR